MPQWGTSNEYHNVCFFVEKKKSILSGSKNIYNWLTLSQILRDSLKHFEIPVPWNIRVAEVRKAINRTTTFNKWIGNLTPEDKDILKILWKRGEIAPQEQFLLFSTIFCYLFLDFHIKTGTRISLRDERLFEISKVEITRVDCILNYAPLIYSTDKLIYIHCQHLQSDWSSFLKPDQLSLLPLVFLSASAAL